MTEAQRAEFAELMLGLGETYGEPVSPVRLEIYFKALADLDLEDVRLAATAHVRASKFFPRPAEIREAVEGPTEDRAELAWMELRHLVRRIGYMRTPKPEDWPDDSTYRAAMGLFGGWRALCERLPSEGPELLGYAKQFKASYGAYERTFVREALPPSKDEARTALHDLKAELVKRGLPTGAL